MFKTQNVPLANIFSADETAINWDKSLRYQYVRSDETPEDNGDSKLRSLTKGMREIAPFDFASG